MPNNSNKIKSTEEMTLSRSEWGVLVALVEISSACDVLTMESFINNIKPSIKSSSKLNLISEKELEANTGIYILNENRHTIKKYLDSWNKI